MENATIVEDDANQALYEHIKFLKRFSMSSRDEGDRWEDYDEIQGLHPGLFAQLPFEILEDNSSFLPLCNGDSCRPDGLDTNNFCSLCNNSLSDVSHQVLLRLPCCNKRVHHECGRKWFVENRECLFCSEDLGAREILDEALNNLACEPHAEIFTDIDTVVTSLISPQSPRLEIEYDGMYQKTANGSLLACKGIVTITTTSTGELLYEGMDKDDLPVLMASMYQGSMTVRSTLCIASFVPAVKGGSSWLKRAFFAKKGLINRIDEGAESVNEDREHQQHQSKEEVIVKKPEPQELPPPITIKASTSTLKAPASESGTASSGYTELSRKSSSTKMVFQNFKNSLTKAFTQSPRPTRRLLRYDSQPQPFQKVYSYTIRGGVLFQRTPFENAVKSCGGSTRNLLSEFSQVKSRILYM